MDILNVLIILILLLISSGLFIYSIVYNRQVAGIERETEITLPKKIRSFLYLWIMLGLVAFLASILGLILELFMLHI